MFRYKLRAMFTEYAWTLCFMTLSKPLVTKWTYLETFVLPYVWKYDVLKHFENTFNPYARREASEPGSTGKLRRAFLTNCRARKRTESLKIHTWTSKCPLGNPLDPWITKMVPQVPKMEPQGFQNDSFRYKKSPISLVNLSAAACWQGACLLYTSPSPRD